MGKTVACIIARMVSTRLPLKVLRSISPEYTMLDFMIQRLKSVSVIDEIYICTSYEAVDEIMEDIALRHQIKVYRGSPENVIDRMLAVAKMTDAEILLRITGDNPFTSTEYIEQQVHLLRQKKLDYVRLVDVPIGATAEVMTHEALVRCYGMMDPSVSEYLMLFMFEPGNFRCGVIKPFLPDHSSITVTVDTPEDLARTKAIAASYDRPLLSISLFEIIQIILEQNIPHSKINGGGQIKLPFGKTVEFEEFSNDMKRRISQSEMLKLYA
jgi:spore coat polysaccharide biosynthesis protein SpsF